jgi:uncharacterized membrane protein
VDAVKYGWKKFTENVGPFLIAGVVCFLAVGLLIGLLYGILFGAAMLADGRGSDAGFGFGFGIGTILLIAIAALLAAFVQAAFINASLRIAAGQKLDVGDFFRLPNVSAALGTSIIVGLATGIGYALFWLPGVVIAVFTMFAIVFALDRGLGPVDAIKASIDLVKNNVVPALLLALAVYILSAIGSAICGIGILATVPIGVLAVVYVYRKLQNQQVAP